MKNSETLNAALVAGILDGILAKCTKPEQLDATLNQILTHDRSTEILHEMARRVHEKGWINHANACTLAQGEMQRRDRFILKRVKECIADLVLVSTSTASSSATAPTTQQTKDERSERKTAEEITRLQTQGPVEILDSILGQCKKPEQLDDVLNKILENNFCRNMMLEMEDRARMSGWNDLEQVFKRLYLALLSGDLGSIDKAQLKMGIAQMVFGRAPSASSTARPVVTASAAAPTTKQGVDARSERERKTQQEAERTGNFKWILGEIMTRCKKANQLDATVEEIVSNKYRIEMLEFLQQRAIKRGLWYFAGGCSAYLALNRNVPGTSLKNFGPGKSRLMGYLASMIFGSILDKILAKCTTTEQLHDTLMEILLHESRDEILDEMRRRASEQHCPDADWVKACQLAKNPEVINNSVMTALRRFIFTMCFNMSRSKDGHFTVVPKTGSSSSGMYFSSASSSSSHNAESNITQSRSSMADVADQSRSTAAAPSTAMQTTGSSSSGVYFSSASSSSSRNAGSNNTQPRSSMADVNVAMYNDTDTDSGAKPKPLQ